MDNERRDLLQRGYHIAGALTLPKKEMKSAAQLRGRSGNNCRALEIQIGGETKTKNK